MKRRQFLQGLALSVVLPARSGAALGSAPPRAIAIYDPRYAEAVHFAQTVGARQGNVWATGEDFGRLWFARLEPVVVRQRPTLAGITTYADYLFLSGCLDDLGIPRERSIRFIDGAASARLVAWLLEPERRR